MPPIIGFLLAALACALPSVVWAQEHGNYAALAGGANLAADSRLTGAGVDTEAGFDAGWVGAAAFGHMHRTRIRAEVEIAARGNGVGSLAGGGGSGRVRVWSLMVNGAYDIDTATPFTPYLGGGIGAAMVEADALMPIAGSKVDDSATVFAYQAIAGLGYRLGDRLHLFGDYRYFATSEAGLRTDGGTAIDAEYASHVVMVGVRWSLGGHH
ncbi:MAG: outer membrane beta-barrel protein [Rhodospirillales bacterium]|jgi:opacity protein-like surface antigen|nr:outer membrane beta-barrel protein [Rhodospirillales bacterium]MDP6774054.1 outer membrane beta-barrel protein [Rhodospirillales bacterium]